jgi:hypothetical protein
MAVTELMAMATLCILYVEVVEMFALNFLRVWGVRTWSRKF